MAASSYCRGWCIKFQDSQWVYVDTNEPIDPFRPCCKCGELPTKDGHDFCLGTLKGVGSACCGHGVEKSYVH